MKRILPLVLGLAALTATRMAAQPYAPASPWEMAVSTERWLVDGAGARFPDEMATPARESNNLVFVDEDWPLSFQNRIGEEIVLRISPDTGCYEFEDADGIVFWIVVPYAPLTWNWISPFRSPLCPDTQNLYSPFRLMREWRLTTPEIEEPRKVPMHRAPLRSALPGPVTNLCFTAFAITNNVLFFTVDWPTNEALPEAVVDVYCSTNGLNRFPFVVHTNPATNPPVSFSFLQSLVPNYGAASAPVHSPECEYVTNIVMSPLDGNTVYTNATWNCSHERSGEAAFFQLGTRHDTDGDGLFDAFEKLSKGTNPALSDTDCDGLSDGEEHSRGIDPLFPDSDDDGMSDEEEVLSGSNPLVPGLPVGGTIRYCYDEDDRLVGAFPGVSPAAASVRWSATGNPERIRERSAQ